jgi:hypothetical protein
MTRSLNSDQLGAKGESRFQELCVDGGLIPNASTWDRKGWDFVVDWPHTDPALPFDSRPTLLSCLMQVKTVWQGAGSIQVVLSSLEHVAKDLKPSFICVLGVDDSLALASLRVIPISGNFLGFVLKNLRSARAAQKTLNKTRLNIPLRQWGTKISHTGATLRAFLENEIGPTVAVYAARKQKELADLGFGTNRYSLTTTFVPEDGEHLVDAFLGLRPIAAIHTSAAETRFGIPIALPEFGASASVLEVQPKPIDKCSIFVRSAPNPLDPLDPENAYGKLGPSRFGFKGEIFKAPDYLVPKGEAKLLVRAHFFDLKIIGKNLRAHKVEKRIQLLLKLDKINTLRANCADWKDLFLFLVAVASEALIWEVRARKAGELLVGMTMVDAPRGDLDDFRHGAATMSDAATIFSYVGWPGHKVTIAELNSERIQLAVLHAMLHNPQAIAPLRFTTEPLVDSSDEKLTMDMLYINKARFRSFNIAFAAVLTAAGRSADGQVEWTGRFSRFVDAKRIGASMAAFRQFGDSARERSGVRAVITIDGAERLDGSLSF